MENIKHKGIKSKKKNKKHNHTDTQKPEKTSLKVDMPDVNILAFSK